MEFCFYHFVTTNLERVIFQISDKIYNSGKKLLILCKDEDQLSSLDQSLWSLGRISFLPHATINDPFLEEQKIILSTKYVDLQFDYIINLSAEDLELDLNNIEKLLYVFDGNNEEELELARIRWKKENRYTKVYYKQDDKGNWEKK